MFRDLKEYQEIAKIYAEKVSKPAEVESDELVENQENRRKLTQQRQQQNAGRAEKQFSVLKPKPIQGRVSRSSQNMSGKPKPMPTTAEIRAKDDASGGSGMSNIPSKEGNAVIDGKKLNPDFGKKVDIKKEFPDKASEVETKTEVKKPKMGSPGSKYIKKDKGVGFVKRGTPMAQRAENKEKNKMRAQEMAKERIAAKKKAEAEMSNEEFTPYDLVLEYLLSTEQAATIEEANYVMTEMDAETIQGIVEAQKKTLIEKPDDGYIGPKFLGIKNPMNKARKDYQMDYKLKKLSGTGDSPQTRDMLDIPRDYEITPEQKQKYGFK